MNALTKEKAIVLNGFAADTLHIAGHLAMFGAYCTSVVVSIQLSFLANNVRLILSASPSTKRLDRVHAWAEQVERDQLLPTHGSIQRVKR